MWYGYHYVLRLQIHGFDYIQLFFDISMGHYDYCPVTLYEFDEMSITGFITSNSKKYSFATFIIYE